MQRVFVHSLSVWLLVSVGCDSKESTTSPPAKKGGAEDGGKSDGKSGGQHGAKAAEAGKSEGEGKGEAVKDDSAAKEGAEGPEGGGPPPGVKVKGNVPAVKASELAAEDKAREECVAECVAAKVAQARGADDIEAGCRQECGEKFPIRQVEVIPDGPESP